MMFQSSILLPLLPSLAAAIAPPRMEGMNELWSERFEGPAGASPDRAVWNIMDSINTNNEVQTYTTSNQNLQISGGGTIQFVPRKSPKDGHWTSGRIETVGSWTPEPGKVTKLAASILLGTNSGANKQGMWPAFWALGDAMRHGTEWPMAGEIDIFEQVSGTPKAHGTVHCGNMGGGPCNEPVGRGMDTELPADGVFHEYAVNIDRTNEDWRAQTITWTLNGKSFYVLTGAEINDAPVWSTLAHSPLYLLLNLAVGGDWPGPPNDATLDGYGSMMEVQWVGVWST
ncbi:hypothetical protein DL764_004944 [Monosporascus ibericus]|uniref:GH16 domain-containing protein n=1 Tax=Monosporascus ibericus TaxID=155417 RepID=A0A4Q4TE16_9PEZI|nr:hypothetical protein DL764_004944 [Monosporascus ibericus]